MLFKKLLFLSLPLVYVYWRSRTAQQAVRWLFRGVVPEEGAFGKVMTELRQNPEGPPGGGAAAPVQRRPRSTAAKVADNWPVLLAFICGIAITAILFARYSHPE